jgi:hypothetical protein
VSRRLHDPKFAVALRDAVGVMRATLVRRVTAEGLAAINRMANRANDPDASPADRLAADSQIIRAAAAVLPREIDAIVAVAAPPVPPDLSNAHAEVETMLAGIRSNRAQTTPEALAAHYRALSVDHNGNGGPS